MFVQPRDEPSLLEIGDKLEAMTSQLKPSQFIEEYFSGGPKNYSYKIVDYATGERNTVCKVRGITLTYNASKLVNFEVIKDMNLGKTETEHVTVHTEKKINWKRKAEEGVVSIITEPEDKLYRISFFKRQRLNDVSAVWV